MASRTPPGTGVSPGADVPSVRGWGCPLPSDPCVGVGKARRGRGWGSYKGQVLGDVCREGLSGALPLGAAALPCTRVELCRKMRILLAFLTTHVSFLGGQRGETGHACPK